MAKNLKISAIIAAAGKGERAGFSKNKLLAPLYGAPALWHTLKKFDMPEIDEVIIASSEFDFKEVSALAEPFGFKVVTGGKTRTESVKNALAAITGDIVLIHDGARPFLSRELIIRCIDSVKRFGSAVCALPATETTATANYGLITGFYDRTSTVCLQTPQGFITEEIRRAYELAGDRTFTDDSSVYCEFCAFPHIVEGEKENIKLTFAEDFKREYAGLSEITTSTVPSAGSFENAGASNGFAPFRVGFGVDIHSFCKGNKVTLAGIEIECENALWAHSDGDVVFHAVTDALFSAAGLKDIGHYFPDSDPQYKGADSAKLCTLALKEVEKAGYAPENISISVQAEKPRLAAYVDKMISKVAHVLKIPEKNVAIAAGTCEHLGFVGEGQGIAAYAYVLLRKI